MPRTGGDIRALWTRLKETDLQITEWRGNSAFVFAPTGAATADYIQIALGREIAWRAGPIVTVRGVKTNYSIPAGPGDRPLPDTARLTGPIYRLLDRAGGAVVHVRSFLRSLRARRAREARGPAVRTGTAGDSRVGPDGTREIPILQEVPDYFEFVPREPRFFRDWEAWSAGTERVFAHWALDAAVLLRWGERVYGF